MSSLIDLIGNTPLVEITKAFHKPGVKIYAKLEGQNPGGSVKDRAAYFMIKNALADGSLKTSDTIIEATSGNTGIALAMIASVFGIKTKLVMPASATPERVGTMKAYGAEVILTPAEKTIEYSRSWAQEQADEHGYIILDQFNNPNNRQAHIETTGPEIWKDTAGEISHFISSMGTTGTITGTGIYLKSKSDTVKIVGAQPEEGSRIPGIRKWTEAYLPEIFQPEVVDQIEYVNTTQAMAASRQLAKEEGIFAGMSSGGAFEIAKRVAKRLESGTLVFIACDRGDRYLSSDLYL